MEYLLLRPERFVQNFPWYLCLKVRCSWRMIVWMAQSRVVATPMVLQLLVPVARLDYSCLLVPVARLDYFCLFFTAHWNYTTELKRTSCLVWKEVKVKSSSCTSSRHVYEWIYSSIHFCPWFQVGVPGHVGAPANLPPWKEPLYPLSGRVDGPQSGSGRLSRKMFSLRPGIKPWFLNHPASI